MKSPEEIAEIIDRYNLADRAQLRNLEAHVRRELTIREVLFFADFLHGGRFSSASGKWRRDGAGFVAQTYEEDKALGDLWAKLVRTCYLYVGAASILKMTDSRLVAGYAFADETDCPTFYDYHLDALIRAVPKEYRKQLDAREALDALHAQGDRIEKQGERTAQMIENRTDTLDAKATETARAVAYLVGKDKAAKDISIISWEDATAIFKRSAGFAVTERTIRYWLKWGMAAKTNTPISRQDLASTKVWSAWVDTYAAAFKSRANGKKIISAQEGKVIQEQYRKGHQNA